MGDRLMLRKALRPARRLLRGLFCTSVLSSYDLGKIEGQSTAGRPAAPRTGTPEQGQA